MKVCKAGGRGAASQVELVLARRQTGHILYAGVVASADLQESTHRWMDGGRTRAETAQRKIYFVYISHHWNEYIST